MNPSFSREEITFQNNNDKLLGVLEKPPGQGPFPAIIFVHGDGPGDRYMYQPIADAFLKKGFACLMWDRPGVDKSTGNWVTQKLNERMNETTAALTFIRGRADIEQKRVGIWGISAGGTFIPQIAATGDIAFAILVSPGLNTRAETLTYQYTREHLIQIEKMFQPMLDKIGFSTSDKDQMEAFYISYAELRSKQDLSYDELRALLKNRESKPWFQKLCKTGFVDDSEKNQTREEFRRDQDEYLHACSGPFLTQTRCPILVILGADDAQADPVANAKYCQEAIVKAGPDIITVRTFPHSDHMLLGTPGYIDLMCAWLQGK